MTVSSGIIICMSRTIQIEQGFGEHVYKTSECQITQINQKCKQKNRTLNKFVCTCACKLKQSNLERNVDFGYLLLRKVTLEVQNKVCAGDPLSLVLLVSCPAVVDSTAGHAFVSWHTANLKKKRRNCCGYKIGGWDSLECFLFGRVATPILDRDTSNKLLLDAVHLHLVSLCTCS